MKKTSIILAGLLMASVSFGIVSVDWGAIAFQSGVEGNTDQFLTADESTTALLWELVYVSGGAIGSDPAKPEVTGKDRTDINYGEGTTVLSSRYWDRESGTVMTVKDVYGNKDLDSLTFNTEFATIEEGSTSYLNDSFPYTSTDGGVYAAVFQYCANGNDTDVYWAATKLSLFSVDNRNDSAKEISFTDEDPYTTPKYLGTITGVPEPATMSLLGLGALAMVIRRKLRK